MWIHGLQSALAVTLLFLLLSLAAAPAALAAEVGDLIGKWDMIHDDWVGILEISPSDQRQNAVDGSCTYTFWSINGQWTAASGGPSRPVSGTFQGYDSNLKTVQRVQARPTWCR